MSQELRDLQAALDAERAEHAMTRMLAITARAALVSETVAHTHTRAVLTTTQTALTNAMIVHGQEVTAHANTTQELVRFQARHTTNFNYIVELLTELRDLKRTLAATQAALVVAEEARHDAQAFAMQF